MRRLRRPYTAFCAAVIVLWLIAWLASFHNIYGWLVDDEDTFYRFQNYALGGRHLVDIQWFHAYMWFLMLPQLLFHFSIPSHVAPRAFLATGQFRALILYTIFLHAIVLALIARFLAQLCSNRVVCGAAFVLIATSPTLALYAPLLDSRYLSLLAALPALTMMLQEARRGFVGDKRSQRAFFACGFLLGLAEDIHYECLYLTVPFAIVFWLGALIRGRDSRRLAALFAAGLCAWVVPVQILSLFFHPFSQSYIGTLLNQYSIQIPPYTRQQNVSTWFNLFVSEMGYPMMAAALGGFIILAFRRLRPQYVQGFDAAIVLATSALFSGYLFESLTHPFYRMAFCYQFFYALAACIFIERITQRISRSLFPKMAVAAAFFVAVAFIPSLVRTPPVFAAHQGFGAAVNSAYNEARHGQVYFIDLFDGDAVPQAIIDREQFDDLDRSDYLVTYFPLTFHFKYPDIFALLQSIKPAARYPTLWCTQEMWAQAPTFYGTRNWTEEPENCEARVYRVADIRRALHRPSLVVTGVQSDSRAMAAMDVKRVFAKRRPSDAWYGLEMWKIYWDLWVSSDSPGPHWIDVEFSKPAKLSRVILVPPDFRVPPDFLWYGRTRVSDIAIDALRAGANPKRVWARHGLENSVIIDAKFSPVFASGVRLLLWQSPGPNQRVGLKYVDFPEYRIVTRWKNLDAPGKPGPGR
ncbi:MAG TPA: hypothetical protein VGZ02_04730 [Candidatus Baltobacteraceae bacterium]|nr:hypothetical protein [Candidatus Baltobacteraceae bacterium]